MKKILLAAMLIVCTANCFCQTRKQILNEIHTFQIEFITSKKFDVEKSKLFQSILSVGSNNNQIVRESEKRGFVDFYYEDQFQKYTTSVEIISDNQPYDLLIQIVLENRTIDYTTNTYTQWTRNYNINNYYICFLKLKIYENLFGPIVYPEELSKKINQFNSKQKKEKNKIVKGTDY